MKRFGRAVEKASLSVESGDSTLYDTRQDDKFLRETENWLLDRMDKYSGNANSGYFKPGSHGEKAYKDCLAAYEKQDEREEQIKKEAKIKTFTTDYGSKVIKSDSEYARFRKACKSDKVWNSLKENSDKSDQALCSAVLRDIGLSDTPENRKLIEWYVFLD